MFWRLRARMKRPLLHPSAATMAPRTQDRLVANRRAEPRALAPARARAAVVGRQARVGSPEPVLLVRKLAALRRVGAPPGGTRRLARPRVARRRQALPLAAPQQLAERPRAQPPATRAVAAKQQLAARRPARAGAPALPEQRRCRARAADGPLVIRGSRFRTAASSACTRCMFRPAMREPRPCLFCSRSTALTTPPPWLEAGRK